MKRTFVLIACLCTLVVAGCTSESKLPNPTGKGSIRAFNAIPGSPDIRFLIEERTLDVIGYQDSTSSVRYDDFEYNFNFELFLPGEIEPDRVLTLSHKIETRRDDIFLLTGDPANPTLTVWSAPEREWSDSDTVVEVRFAHTIYAQDAVDIYLDEAVVPAVVNNKVATLSYGEITDLSDYQEGTYIVTITEAGDVNAVLFQSTELIFAVRSSVVIAGLAGNENDTSSIVLSAMLTPGGDRKITDATASPTVRFFHASYALQTSDIYDDEMLTSRRVENHAYGEITGDLDVSGDLETYYYTPTGSTAAILHQFDYQAAPGRHTNLLILGPADDYTAFSYLPDRASVSLYAKLNLFNAALDSSIIDLYLTASGVAIADDDLPSIQFVLYPGVSSVKPVEAGSYDVYVTPVGEKTVLAGPLPIDLVNGDIVNLLALDTGTPDVVELKIVPAP